MSKIPFMFTPIPTCFYENGSFDNPHTVLFVTWAFSKCSPETRVIFHDGKELTLQPYEFITGRRSGSTGSLLTPDAFRHQLNTQLKRGFLKKSANCSPNRYTGYIWVTERFSQTHPQQNANSTPTGTPTEHPQSRIRKEKKKIDPPLTPPSESPRRNNNLFSKSGEKLIEIWGDVFLTQRQLDDCIAARGDLETVKLIVQQISATSYKIKDWVGNIKKWNIKDDLQQRIIEHETLAKKLEGMYSETQSGWTCRIYNDKRKDQKGLLFEGRGAYVEPIFIPFSYYDFKKQVAKIIREKCMQKSLEKQEQTC